MPEAKNNKRTEAIRKVNAGEYREYWLQCYIAEHPKKLGFTQKAQIEEYGIAEFNALCLDSVDRYEKDWRVMVERIGHWIDLDDPYFTYTNTYVESAWWALKNLSEKGLLDQGYKIQPFCTRCGTSLSSHEVAQNYQDTDDPSVWVRFPLRSGQAVTDVDGQQHVLDSRRTVFHPERHVMIHDTMLCDAYNDGLGFMHNLFI